MGGDQTIGVDVRVIVATHHNLDELALQRKFWQDLFRRVYVFPFALHPCESDFRPRTQLSL
ncbi:MAG: sigma 54-interacting transcriptional regulator [Terriglobia bacterium]